MDFGAKAVGRVHRHGTPQPFQVMAGNPPAMGYISFGQTYLCRNHFFVWEATTPSRFAQDETKLVPNSLP